MTRNLENLGFWTAERDAQLRKLRAENKTATEIMQIMHASSRSAVLGRCFRLKIPTLLKATRQHTRAGRRLKTHLLQSPVTVQNERKAVRRIFPKPMTSNYGLSANGAKTGESVPPQTAEAFSSLFAGRGISLFNARPHQCRWPFDNRGPDGSPRCCGERRAADDLSYCGRHQNISASKHTQYMEGEA